MQLSMLSSIAYDLNRHLYLVYRNTGVFCKEKKYNNLQVLATSWLWNCVLWWTTYMRSPSLDCNQGVICFSDLPLSHNSWFCSLLQYLVTSLNHDEYSLRYHHTMPWTQSMMYQEYYSNQVITFCKQKI